MKNLTAIIFAMFATISFAAEAPKKAEPAKQAASATPKKEEKKSAPAPKKAASSPVKK